MRVVASLLVFLMLGCNAILGQHPGIVDDTGCVKQCEGTCARVDDPAYGCTPTSCASCALDHVASSTCSGGACAVSTCEPAYDDLDLDPSNGCESPNPLAFAPGSLALWLRADRGVVVGDAGVSGWTNQAGDGAIQPTTAGAPSLDTSSWPGLAVPSVSFSGSDAFGVDLAAMMSSTGFTTFLAYARYGNSASASTNAPECILSSPTYPSGDPSVNCPAAAGSAFALGYLSNTIAYSEVYCNSMWLPSAQNGATSYQTNLAAMWFDPETALDYFALNGNPLSDIGQTPHPLTNLSSPSVLGGCPGSPAVPTYTGLVGELVVYSTLLSVEDRAALQSHLKTKWNTP